MTVTVQQRELGKANEIMGLVGLKKFAAAAALARAAAAEFPAFCIPAAEGKPSPKFAQVAKWCEAQVAPAVEPVQKKAPVETAVLRLVHDGDKPTSIFGVEKDSPAHKAIGSKKNGGLGWFWFGDTKSFYLPRSGKFAADMGAIGEAVNALESIERDGVQLYRVEQQISTIGPDGTPLPKKMTVAEKQAWQLRVDGLRNEQKWQLTQGTGVCGGCGMTGLTVQTGKSVRGEDGLPVAKCYNCTGDPAPVVESEPEIDMGALLALPAGPSAEVAPEVEAPKLSKAERKAAKKARKAAERAAAEQLANLMEAAPAPAPVVESAPAPAPAGDSLVGKVWRFSLADGLSNQKRNEVATMVRRDLNERVVSQFKGMEVEVRRDKEKHQLVLTVMEGPEDSAAVNARDLTTMVVGTVLTVRGVAKRMSAPRA